ncbi:MAG: hypothetical protein KC645_10015, partial [Gemmatimonadetes bacterium]|nr:hypothetical protein [Gemmatimonadota bacterium]
WILDDLTPLHQIGEAVAADRYHLYDPRNPYREITKGYYAEGGPGENPPEGLQVNYVLKEAVGAGTPMAMEILDGRGRVVHAEYAPDTRPDCEARPRRRSLSRAAGAHRWSWDLQVGRFACLEELTRTQGDLSAYTAAPGSYTVRMTIGEGPDAVVRSQAFEILIDPRLDEVIADQGIDARAQYAELDRLSESLYQAASEMAEGVAELRRIRQQVDFAMDVSSASDIDEQGEALNATMDAWIEEILQKELKTGQNNYMFEARQLVRFKDLLGRMAGGNLPLTDGVREVTGDYLQIWTDLELQLQTILNEDVPAFNQLLRRAGLPEIYVPRPVS